MLRCHDGVFYHYTNADAAFRIVMRKGFHDVIEKEKKTENRV